MLVEPFELLKLVIGLIILTIPGYLYSYLFTIIIKLYERILFGLLSGLAFFIITTFTLNILFNIKITQTLIWVLYAFYIIPVIIINLLSKKRYKIPKIKLSFFKNKKLLFLIIILIFSFIMMFLPHLVNNYYLPFHVDEWIHWSYTRSIIEQGSTTFINPYTGTGNITSPELGIHLASATIHWISTSNLSTIFLFMPAIIGLLLSLTAFTIGERRIRKFGLEAAFLIAFIPTTVRTLGPSFYTPSTLSLLFLLFIIWLIHLKKTQTIILIPIMIFTTFLIHPVTALASLIILLIYTLFLFIEKKHRLAIQTLLLTILPILIITLLTTRWKNIIDLFFKSASGQYYPTDFNLPKISISFIDMGLLIWSLLVIGVIYAFIKGKTLQKTLSISIITFIIIIGLYDKFNYGFPSIYERMFLYLFLLVTLIAGYALSEIRKTLTKIIRKKGYQTTKKKIKHINTLTPLIICLTILLIAVPTHINTPYYQIISEQEYQTFKWIYDNIHVYRDTNHPYNKAAVEPFKASPFSAVTGLYIISSTMNPIYGIELSEKMQTFLLEKCTNTSFLDKYKISVVYGKAENANLTKIYDKVYLYPWLTKA